MGALITQMFESMTSAVQGFGKAMKEGLLTLIYVDPTATERVVSDLGIFMFSMIGISLGIGLIFSIFKLIKYRGR